MKIFNIFNWFSQLRLYVIADPRDNSVTLSKGLFRKMRIMKYKEEPRAYVFYLPDRKLYGFCINPKIREDAPLSSIQYNTKHRTIGFECLVPTVQKIFFDYGLPSDKAVKLTVSVRDCRNEEGERFKYYIIEKPYV